MVIFLKLFSKTSNIHTAKSAIRENIISPFSNTFLKLSGFVFKMIGTYEITRVKISANPL